MRGWLAKAAVVALMPVLWFSGRQAAPHPDTEPVIELAVKKNVAPIIHQKKVVEKKRGWLARKLIATRKKLARVRGNARRERRKAWKLFRELQRATAAPPQTLSQGFSGPASTLEGTLVEFGMSLQRRGYHVSEHPAFGGVDYGAHAEDSYHYRGEAIDVSGGDLDAVAAEAREWGFNVYWQVPGHYDHVHVDTGPVRPY